MASKSESNSRTSRTRPTEPKAQRSLKKVKKTKQKTGSECVPSDRFVKDLLVRGEAAEPDNHGKLPLEATHAITKKEKGDTVEIKRARFKYF
jgi:predicted KAP-like P-loop ATPase